VPPIEDKNTNCFTLAFLAAFIFSSFANCAFFVLNSADFDLIKDSSSCRAFPNFSRSFESLTTVDSVAETRDLNSLRDLLLSFFDL
jgi:hypothetical protein